MLLLKKITVFQICIPGLLNYVNHCQKTPSPTLGNISLELARQKLYFLKRWKHASNSVWKHTSLNLFTGSCYVGIHKLMWLERDFFALPFYMCLLALHLHLFITKQLFFYLCCTAATYGILCIGMAFVASFLGDVLQVTIMQTSVIKNLCSLYAALKSTV